MPLSGRGLAMVLGIAVVAFAIGRFTASTQPPETARDLPSLIQAALGERDALERQARTATLLGNLRPGDVPAVLAVYERLLPSIEPRELAAFFNAWAHLDPDGAIEYALSFPRRSMMEQRRIGARAVFAGWAHADPTLARSAAEEVAQRHPPLRQEIWSGLVMGWVRSDLGAEGLASFIANLLPQSHRNTAAEIAVRELVRTGGAVAALEWADAIVGGQFQDGAFRRAVFEATASVAAASDPAGTGAWALEHAEAEYAVDSPVIVAGRWARADGAAALEWLGTYPAGAPRDKGVREAFLTWSTADWDGSQAWLESTAPTPLRDLAREVWVEQLIAWEPAEALGGCEQILDETGRQRCRVSGAKRWYATDAVAAEEWLQTSPLDEATRSQVRNEAGNLGSRARRPRARDGLR